MSAQLSLIPIGVGARPVFEVPSVCRGLTVQSRHCFRGAFKVPSVVAAALVASRHGVYN